MKHIILIIFAVAIAAFSGEIKKNKNIWYDYFYTNTYGTLFHYEIDGSTVVEHRGVPVCEYKMKSGKKLLLDADGDEVGDKCSPLRFAFITTIVPYTKKGRTAEWVCMYGWSGHTGYMVAFKAKSCPDVIMAFGRGAWLDEFRFGDGAEFTPDDFGNVPTLNAYYDEGTLEHNPRFAARVKYRERFGNIVRAGGPKDR